MTLTMFARVARPYRKGDGTPAGPVPFDWTQPMDVLRAELELRTNIDPTLPERLDDALNPYPPVRPAR